MTDAVRPTWRGKRSQAAVLMRHCQRATFWRDTAGAPYATVGDGASSAHFEVGGSGFRQWLARGYFDECGGAPTSAALNDTVAYAAARGAFGQDVRPVFLRIGADGPDILVDACDGAGTVVRIGSGAVTAEQGSAVAFRRAPSAGPLPPPEEGGSLADLRQFVNVGDEDWPLVAGWLVAAVRPVGPFPVLFLHGEQGSGKSTQARVLRALVDPNFAALRAAPRDVQDLAVSAHNNWVMALDNLSSLPTWLSDALCRLSTGGGFATRALYANDRETVFHAQRPALVTGIEDIATRGDLLDRSLIVHLPLIPARRRLAESDFWREFNAARPALFGALCGAAAAALAAPPAPRDVALPRLADFAVWASRAAPSFGCTASDFAAVYARGVAEHSVAAMEASALARPLVRLAVAGDWRGTASDLVYAVETSAGRAGARTAGWPRSPTQFAGCVRRLAPSLRAIGINVAFEREPGTGRRLISLAVADRALALAHGWDGTPGARHCQRGPDDPFG